MGEVAAPVRDGDDVLAPVLGADRPKLVEVAVLLELRKPELLNDVIRLEGHRHLAVVRPVDVDGLQEHERLLAVRQRDRALHHESVDPLRQGEHVGELGEVASCHVAEIAFRERVAHRVAHHVEHADHLVALEERACGGGESRLAVGIDLEGRR